MYTLYFSSGGLYIQEVKLEMCYIKRYIWLKNNGKFSSPFLKKRPNPNDFEFLVKETGLERQPAQVKMIYLIILLVCKYVSM